MSLTRTRTGGSEGAGLSDVPSLPREASPGRLPTGWTDERVELLRQLWSQGLTTSQIAAQLGGISRNAVIGKAHRIGLGEPRGARLSATEVNRRRRERRRERATEAAERRSGLGLSSSRLLERFTGDPSPELGEASLDIPVGQRRTILELAAGKCRWPLWGQEERSGFYCGGQAIDGHSYCGFHCRMAYAPVQPRRGRPYVARGEAA